MKSSELRAKARESLSGKWGKAALLTLVYVIIEAVISGILNKIPYVGSIANAVISPVITFGFLVTMIKLSRSEEPTYFSFLTDGFNSFTKVWAVIFQTCLKMLVPIIIIVVGVVLMTIGGQNPDNPSALVFVGAIVYIAGFIYAIPKGYLYQLTSFILYDEPELSATEIVEKSESLMMGNRWRLFCLQFSFIGWVILGGITLGIGFLWIMPYIQISITKFYEELAGSPVATEVATEPESEPIVETAE